MRRDAIKLEAVFPFSAMPAEQVARVCVLLLLDVRNTENLLLYGQCVTEETLYRKAGSRRHFDIQLAESRMGWGGVKNHDLACLTATGLPADSAQRLRQQLSQRMPLVVARFYDEDYEYWQNADDPLEYEAEGRSMAGLPMKSNGLPFPLEQQVVDTSRNPGRRVLRQGYVEAIGHRMWLGPEYFARVPDADRDGVAAADWLQVTEIENGILEIIAADEPFTDDTTADLQHRLRKLLFKTTG